MSTPTAPPTPNPKTGFMGRISDLWNFENPNPKARDASRVAMVMAFAGLGSVPVYIFLGLQTGAWQIGVLVALNLVIAVGSVIGAIYCRRGQVERGMSIVLGTLLVVCISAAALIQIGMILSLAYFLLSISAITQSLTSRAAYRAIAINLAGCMVIGLLEIYPPAFQYPIPEVRSIILSLVGVILVFFFILSARKIRSYPLHIKLVITFMLVALFPAAVTAFLQFQTSSFTTNAIQTELTLLITAGLSGVIALSVAQLISGPIERLTTVAENIIAGDLKTQAKVESDDEVGRLARTFNNMTNQLQQTLAELEVVAEVSGQLNAILNIDQLITELVTQVKERFGFYHVQIYLMDAEHKNLHLAAGYGEPGKQMKANSHHFALDAANGLVPRTARDRVSLLIQNVRNEPGWLANPFLPDTQAELSVPIIVEGQVVGVMDVQSDKINGLDEGDSSMLRSLSNQVAVAITNARLFEQTKQRAWQTEGQAQLNDRMRGEQDLQTLGNNVIEHLCQYLQAQVGTLYTLENNRLTLTSSYAYIRRDNVPDQFQIGEGLVGQAAREKKVCTLHLPDDYIRITSASLGELIPRSVLALPLLYSKQVLGVIELGTLSEFSPAQIEFLNSTIESIAIAFSTAQARTQVNELLAQTRQQAEELQTQEEELRATNEELEAQTESLLLSEGNLRKNQAVLNQQNQELRAAQQELERKAEELAITSKYKSEFLANMSHELRTPLNSLLILSGMLAKNEGGNLTSNQIESAKIIYGSGSDLLQLINDILDLSKVEAGHMTFHFAPMPLGSLAQNMRTQFTHVAEEKNLEFKINLAAGLPESIITDQQRAEQVIKNLLSNAFKFTEQGAIQLNIELTAEKMVAIHVQDSGIGMTHEQQQRVFEAFQQADGSTSRKYGGTGLGLTISREMTAKLGGRIGVESAPGKGSVFTLYLPLRYGEGEAESAPKLAPVSATATVAEGVPASTGNTPTSAIAPFPTFPPIEDDRDNIQSGDKVLLVIEDDPTFAKVLLGYARKRDFKCMLTGDGESGLKLVNAHRPDAILLDLNLPGMSGWDVLDTLKEDGHLRHIPVHILSASSQTMDAYKRGALGFLSKPLAPEQLDSVFGMLGKFLSRDIKSLLIVEDDNVLRYSVGQLLGGSDVKISEAARGDEALALLHETYFDCMILDLTLPDMSGFELLSKMNEDPALSKCPVIVYTGKAITEEENEELLKYTNSVIIKGVKSPERLLDETALFLHRVVADMPAEKQNTIRLLHDRDAIFSGKHILVVDDNTRNAFALSSLLHEKNLRSTIARSGMKALEMLETVPDIDLVLMDIMMPEMDGYEVMRRIRVQSQFKNLPILALTAKAMKGDMEKCIAAGANDYLSKPIDADRLFALLRIWLYR